MIEYHKINTIYKRDLTRKGKKAPAPIIDGEYTTPEFAYLADNLWIATEKIDGTNVRVHWGGDKVVFGGRSDNAQMPVALLSLLQEAFQEGTFREHFGYVVPGTPGITFYGEGFGRGIQNGGGYTQGLWKDSGLGFALFDVMVGDLYLKRENVEIIASEFGVPVVPIVAGVHTLPEATDICRAGFKSAWGNMQAEGLVLRTPVELKMRSGNRVIGKLKCRDFVHNGS